MNSLQDPAATAAILRRLEGLRPESRRRWGTLTPGEMVTHLADSFRAGLGEREVSGARMPFAGLMKWFAVDCPLPWPHGIATRPEVDPRRAGTRPIAFEGDVAALRTLITRYAASGAALEGRAHPLLGPLTAREWLTWGWRHADHHLRQFGL